MRVLSPEAGNPVSIKKKGGERLTIVWGDQHESVYQSRYLRGRCPCAQCVSETTGQRMVYEEHVNPDVKIQSAQIVGNYAIHFEWSDGHFTGIYSFDLLRRLCPCATCAGAAAS